MKIPTITTTLSVDAEQDESSSSKSTSEKTLTQDASIPSNSAIRQQPIKSVKEQVQPQNMSSSARLLQLKRERQNGLSSVSISTSSTSSSRSRPFVSPSGPVGASRQGLTVPGVFPAIGSPQRMDAPGAGPRRQKVSLKPGHSAMDWEQCKKKTNVKGIDPSYFPLRVDKEELSRHKGLDDFWICLGKKVYNLTAYLEYHPGGVEILKNCAGKDATSIFNKYHRWVNYERILDECFIGFMV